MTIPLYLMPLFPLLGFLITITFGKQLKGNSSGWIASTMVLLSFLVAFLGWSSLASEAKHQVLWQWLPDMGTVARGAEAGTRANLSVGFYLDQLSSIMTLVITGVGFLIHIFSIGYMADDARKSRYFAFLNFFVALMLILVLADSYPLIFVGWEGVGMASYLLIGFWYSSRDNANAARKAFIMNRIGDLGFMLGMFLLFKMLGTLVIPDMIDASQTVKMSQSALELACLFLLVGAVGKSAQLPLTTWLPDAMAGPTPVSALIHAATMVTAGVYLITRSSFLFDFAPVAQNWVAWVGGLTALYGALSALNQHDIKKILAFSTVSQIGYMFLAVGLGAYWAAIFHLVTHAFFKALLFLSSGSVIHGLHGEQDVRKMGGLRKALPFTHAVSLIGTLAIAGIPPLAGFFSKDAILLEAYQRNLPLYIIGLTVALLTAFYMMRWYLLVFAGTYRGVAHPYEGGAIFKVPLGILAALTTVGGLLGLPHFLGGNYLQEYLKPVVGPFTEGKVLEPSQSTEFMLIALAVGAALLGFLLAFLRYRAHKLSQLRVFGETSSQALYLNTLYDETVGRPARALSRGLDAADGGVTDALEGIGVVSSSPGWWTVVIQNGFVRSYAASMLLGTLVLMGYWLFKVLGGSS